jgi:hypothetical protein
VGIAHPVFRFNPDVGDGFHGHNEWIVRRYLYGAGVMKTGDRDKRVVFHPRIGKPVPVGHGPAVHGYGIPAPDKVPEAVDEAGRLHLLGH